MLQAIREKTSGWLAYLIIFLISIPFALVGVNSYFGGGSEPPLAKVGDVEIDSSRFNQAYSNYRQRLSQMFGGQIPEMLGTAQMLKRQVLQQLIDQEVLNQHVLQRGLYVDDAQLGQLLSSMPEFQTDGKFDQVKYQAQIRSLGYSTSGFESLYRQDRIVAQFRDALSNSAIVLPYEANYQAMLDTQQRRFEYVLLKAAEMPEISEQELRTEYESNSSRYIEPERIQLDYIELSPQKLADSVEINEQDLRNRYQDNISAYTEPAKREASHILIKVPGDADAETAAKAKAKIEDLRQQIEQGADFAALAKANSEDSFSAQQGGSLGEIEPGIMVKPFEDAVFAMNQVGEISQPVKSSFGWHLIRLDAIQPAKVKSFEAVRSQIAKNMRTEQAETRLYDWSEQLANLSYENPDSLLPASETLGLPIQSTEWFTRSSGNGLANNSEVRQAGFSDVVLKDGLNSDVIQLDEQKLVVVRLKQHQEEYVPEFDKVKEQIRSTLSKNRQKDASMQRAEATLKSLRQGELTLQALAEREQSTLQQPDAVKRTGSDLPAALVRKAFSLPKPVDDQAEFAMVAINGDQYALLKLDAVVDGMKEATDPQQAQQQAQTRGQEELALTQNLLTDLAKVETGDLQKLLEE